MKRSLMVLALAGALTMGGCSTVSSLIGGSSLASSAPAAMMAAEKSLVIAHLAYDGIGHALISAAGTGALHGHNAAMARTFYAQAGDAILVADKADAAANTQGIVDAVTTATEAISQANALVTHPAAATP